MAAHEYSKTICDCRPVASTGPTEYSANPIQTGVFTLSLDTEDVRQLSNYVEPRAILGDDVTVVTETCWGPGSGRVYALFLP